jgi:excisionase family DNA binding protein
MTVQEAAAFLGKHEETVRRWIRQGKIRAERVGELGNFMIHRDDLTAAMSFAPFGKSSKDKQK